jgi:hypothetical protein
MQMLDAGRTMLLVSDRLKQLDILEEMLLDVGVRPDMMAMCRGESKAAERKRAKSAGVRIILGTLATISIGWDRPDLDAVLLAMPHGNIDQLFGRPLRYFVNKKVPMFVELTIDVSMMGDWGTYHRGLFRREKCQLICNLKRAIAASSMCR